MTNQHLQVWYEHEREFTPEEKLWLQKLMNFDFKGKDAIIKQLQSSKVIGQCACGCKTINIRVDHAIEQYPYSIRVPVEMTAIQSDGIPIVFLLHVLNGYIAELEIFKADSSPVSETIKLDNISITVNQQ